MAETLWGEQVAWAPEPEPEPTEEERGGPGADQLAFGENQPAIWDAEPEPRQLALLPEPEPWEADRPAPAGTPRGRLARRRARTAPPGQLSLF